jgi:hypothetical protein
VANCVAVLFVRNAMIKVESYDQFFAEIQTRITAAINTMKAIDIRGSFQSDDEVGGVFEQMYALVESLDVFLLEPTDEETNAPKE